MYYPLDRFLSITIPDRILLYTEAQKKTVSSARSGGMLSSSTAQGVVFTRNCKGIGLTKKQKHSLDRLESEAWHGIRHFYLEHLRQMFPTLPPDGPVNLSEYNEYIAALHTSPWQHWVSDLPNPASQATATELDRFPNPLEVGLQALNPADGISVVVPVYNEENTIVEILQRLASVPIVNQVVVVNDASRDLTGTRLAELQLKQDDSYWTRRLPSGLLILSHPINQGKGAALKTGFAETTEPWVAIQDADTEYNPDDLLRLLHTAKLHNAQVVYGSRFALPSSATSPTWHRLGNSLITRLANLSFGLQLTDVETCYKLIQGPRLRGLAKQLKENRFGVEIELTAKLARQFGCQFAECPINYDRRTYAQGKKIGIRDGFRALYCMIRYRWAG